MKLDFNVIFKNIKRVFIPSFSLFIFSFVCIVPNAVDYSSFASLSELVSNDLQNAKTLSNGLVELKLQNKKIGSNSLNIQKYYYSKISDTNATGVDFAVYESTTLNVKSDFFSTTTNFDGSISLNSYKYLSKYKLELIDGDGISYSSPQSCLISKSLALQICDNLSIEDPIGCVLNAYNTEFSVCGVVDDSSYISNYCGLEKYIVFYSTAISSNDFVFDYYLLLNPDNYYDNYSTLNWFFKIYNKSGDTYFIFSIKSNDWIEKEINYFFNNAEPENRLILVRVLYGLSFIIGFAYGFFYIFKLKNNKNKKSNFCLLYSLVVSYITGILFFSYVFNHRKILTFHINMFSSYSMIFCVLYLIFIIIGFIFGLLVIKYFKKVNKKNFTRIDI